MEQGIKIAIGVILIGLLVVGVATKGKPLSKIPPTKSVPATITPIPNPQEIFDRINTYRTENSAALLLSDKNACSIAERYIASGMSSVELKHEDYRDLCSNCIKVAAVTGKNISTLPELINAWTADPVTKEVIENKDFKYGCVVANGNNVTFVFSLKNFASSTPGVSGNVSAEPFITCIGPDGKSLYTTPSKCEEFNLAWGKRITSVYPSIPNLANIHTQKTAKYNTYCYNNTYRYAYYTTSAAQCSTDNTRSAKYYACLQAQKPKLVDCQTNCKIALNDENAMCSWGYVGINAGIEQNSTLYGNCLSTSANKNYVCLSACSNQYVANQKSCRY